MKKKLSKMGLCKTCRWRLKLKNKASKCTALDPFWTDLFQRDYYRDDWLGWTGCIVCNLYERGKNFKVKVQGE